jgi:hypothetical protein
MVIRFTSGKSEISPKAAIQRRYLSKITRNRKTHLPLPHQQNKIYRICEWEVKNMGFAGGFGGFGLRRLLIFILVIAVIFFFFGHGFGF